MLPWVVIDRTHSRQFLPKSSSLRALCLCVEFSDPLRPTSVVPTTYALPLATAAPQPVCNQSLTHSFYLDGDGYPSSRPANLRTFYRSNVFPGYPLSFHTLAHFFAFPKNSTLLFSSDSALFAKKRGDGVSQRSASFAVFLEIQPGQSGQLSPLHDTPVTNHESRVTKLGLRWVKVDLKWRFELRRERV